MSWDHNTYSYGKYIRESEQYRNYFISFVTSLNSFSASDVELDSGGNRLRFSPLLYPGRNNVLLPQSEDSRSATGMQLSLLGRMRQTTAKELRSRKAFMRDEFI